MKIEDLDKNFVVSKIENEDFIFRNVGQGAFKVFGLPWFEKEGQFCRLPSYAIGEQNPGVLSLAWHTAGAQLRFNTDSAKIAIRVQLLTESNMSHMPATGQSGFDIYLGNGTKKVYKKTAIPPLGTDKYETLIFADEESIDREFTINFPLYNGVKKLEVGLLPGSSLSEAQEFSVKLPVLFYGSSITQGGCASRPGNAYCQILSRYLDFECINFGFSGSARGEIEMAEVIAELELAAFVMDYDHNAPNPEHLEKTHEAFFMHIREKRPNLPIVLVSRPGVENNPEDSEKRKNIILKTYNNALAKGDKNVFWVDGKTLYGENDRDACTVDGVHPNDLGFLRMAQNIKETLKKALEN